MSRKHKHRPASSRATGAAAATGGGGAGAAPLSDDRTPSAWAPSVVLPPESHSGEAGSPPSGLETVLRLPLGRLTPLFSCFRSGEASPLRLLARTAEAHIASTPFADMDTPVTDLAKWRACFPRATALKLSPAIRLPPASLPLLAGVTALDVSGMTDLVALATLIQEGAFDALTSAKLMGCPDDVLLCMLTSHDAPPALVAAAQEAVALRSVNVTDVDIAALLDGTAVGFPPAAVQARMALVAGSTGSKDGSVARTVVKAGGIARAITALRAYKPYAGVITKAAVLLWRLLRFPEYARAVAEAGPAPALLEAVQAHPDNADLVCSASSVLVITAELTPSTWRVLLACGGPRILLEAIQRCLADGDSVARACDALRLLLNAVPDRARPAILGVSHVFDTLFAMLAAHPTDGKLVQTCMVTLGKLDDGSDAVGAAVRRGGVYAIVAAASAHCKIQSIQAASLGLLFFAVRPSSVPNVISVDTLLQAGAIGTARAARRACPVMAPVADEVLQMLTAVAAIYRERRGV